MARGLGLLGMAGILAGCGMLVAPQPQQAPVPRGPLAPILRTPDGALVECRGVPQEPCFSFAVDDEEPGVVRSIVTCTSSCTATEGDVRIDVLREDGSVVSAGGGGYASAASS